ncbi:MAG: hypothetical protein IT236_09465 [Bacteroidia bacterium]|nr:hypothetical protein [Bacteroidia bacterium]
MINLEGCSYKTIGLLVLLSSVFLCKQAKAQSSYDSLNVKLPKHYFNTIIEMDGYNKPSVSLDTTGRRELNQKIDAHLKNYAVKQFNLSFCIPLITKEKKGSGADSAIIENSHLLLTGNFFSLKPVFEGLSQHTLTKRGIGLRYIYNTGKKGVWFFDAAPFVTRDITYRSRPYMRLSGTVVYSHNVSDNFNWRIGATKSFMWGNRLYLPFIGLRFGRLDKINFSFQFPRRVSLNIPFNPKIRMSLYSQPQGGMFNFSNHDTLYPKFAEATFHFTRYEINTGLRFDFKLSSHFNFFVSGGISSKNNITFYSDRANNRTNVFYRTYFYSASPVPTYYVQYGLVIKLGKTRSYYNNRNIYDAIDLNSGTDINDNNSQIPVPSKKLPKSTNLQSIEDLIDFTEF